MKKIIYASYIIFLIISSCKQSTSFNKNEQVENTTSVENSELLYKEVSDSIKIKTDFNERDAIHEIKIKSASINFLIRTINENAYLNVGEVNVKAPHSWQIIKFNFFYDYSFEDAIKEIHLLKAKNLSGGMLMFPSTSEQYKTYHIYKYTNKSIFYLGEYEDSDFNSFKGRFVYDEKQRSLYIQNEAKEIKKLNLLKTQSESIPAKIIEKEKAIITGQLEQTYPSDLKGLWGVVCQNELTALDINKSEGFLSLYDFNAIYINLRVEKSSNTNEYLLWFQSTSSQRDYYDDRLKIENDDDISRDKIIGKLMVEKDGKATLHWIGLYNIKKQKLEFVGDDFLLIKENGGKNPVVLQKCD